MKEKAKTPASREEIIQHIKKTSNWNNGLSDEINARMIELLADEALENRLSIEDMEKNSALGAQLLADSKEARKNGQPHSVTKIDAKTGKRCIALNCGTHKNVIPDEMTLLYDLCSALFRLSKDREKEWISFETVCNNIENTEYVEGWYLPLYQYLIYAISEGIIEPRNSECELKGIEFRLVGNQKLNIIRQFIDRFNRPKENLHDFVKMCFLGKEQEKEMMRHNDDKWMFL